ncbi:hypothetical protein CCACVL1_01005, partial [Corchorus capsularis]
RNKVEGQNQEAKYGSCGNMHFE